LVVRLADAAGAGLAGGLAAAVAVGRGAAVAGRVIWTVDVRTMTREVGVGRGLRVREDLVRSRCVAVSAGRAGPSGAAHRGDGQGGAEGDRREATGQHGAVHVRTPVQGRVAERP